VHPDGTIWTSDDRAAACRIDQDGTQTLLGRPRGTPNGIALDDRGRLVVADIDDGIVYRIWPDGRDEDLLTGLGAPNFPYLDTRGRLWVTVSTRTVPRTIAKRDGIADGYILRVDDGRPVVVADGLAFTNEMRIGPDDHLYVAETTAGHISRYPLVPGGALGPRQAFGPSPLYREARVDGIAFDSLGNLWVTELTRNAVIVLRPDGNAHTVFDDADGTLVREPSSIAFGGPDLRTVYIGSLGLDHIATFTCPWPGVPADAFASPARPRSP
jgi:gluconolactonase